MVQELFDRALLSLNNEWPYVLYRETPNTEAEWNGQFVQKDNQIYSGGLISQKRNLLRLYMSFPHCVHRTLYWCYPALNPYIIETTSWIERIIKRGRL